MKTNFENALDQYCYEFHETRDYFECHEIMEDAWKSKINYTKTDPEVALIMLATAMYHLRRNNIKGATTLLNKSMQLIRLNQRFLESYIDVSQLIIQLNSIAQGMTYKQITIPLLCRNVTTNAIKPDISIIDKHKLRDRSAVIAQRLSALNNKYPVQDPPD